MRKLSILTAFVVLGIGACSSSDPTPAPQSGEFVPRATTTTVETTTTIPPAPPVAESVELPDISDLDIAWDGPVTEFANGTVDVQSFNSFLLTEAPPMLANAATVASWDELADPEITDDRRDELEASYAEAAEEAPEKAIALFVDRLETEADAESSDIEVQVLRVASPAPNVEHFVVVAVDDDGAFTRAKRYELRLTLQDRLSFTLPELDGFAAALEESAAENEPEPTTTPEETGDADPDAEDAEAEEPAEVEAPYIDKVPIVAAITWSVQCQPGLGQQDFAAQVCEGEEAAPDATDDDTATDDDEDSTVTTPTTTTTILTEDPTPTTVIGVTVPTTVLAVPTTTQEPPSTTTVVTAPPTTTGP